ncbi:MAG TPA: FixH family protein [Sediminibacterium sp.]|nr:FixH family protein [Sediminibacterium sp.]
MNWGNKLVVVFVAFALFMGYMVYRALSTKYDLVSKDYYKDELRYQERIDGVKNAVALDSVTISQDASAIQIRLPKEHKGYAVKGEILFYCITDDSKDFKLPLQVDSSATQVVMKKQLQKAPYQVKLNWQVGKDAFYNEQKLIVQ